MARIRSIHPGLFTDEAFMTLTRDAPLAITLLLGLWCEADDAGAFEWKPLTLKARILPAADADVGALLPLLERLDFIRRFEFAGKPFGVVRNFVRYQRPKKPHDVHPFDAESRAYAAFLPDGKRPHSGTGRPSGVGGSELDPSDSDDGSEPMALSNGASSELDGPVPADSYEPVPNSAGTASELRRQRKEEGGRKKEVNRESSSSFGTAPAIDDDLRSRILKAAGGKLGPGCGDLSPIRAFIADGFDFDTVIVPVIADAVASGKPLRSFKPVWLRKNMAMQREKARVPQEPGPENHPPARPRIFVLKDSPDYSALAALCVKKTGVPAREHAEPGGSHIGATFPLAWLGEIAPPREAAE
jgi:hypothetical protein